MTYGTKCERRYCIPIVTICYSVCHCVSKRNLRESKIPVSNLDKPTIEMVADCLSKIYQCQVAINEQGLTMTKLDKNGKEVIVANPHIKIMHDFQAKFIQMSSTLGLTPSARSTIASIRMNNVDNEQDNIMEIIKNLKE